MCIRDRGKRWHGFKLVEGRSNRRYVDEEAVAKAAKDAGYHDIYRQSLIPLTEMERLLGKKRFQEILGALVEKPQMCIRDRTVAVCSGSLPNSK